MKDYFAALAFLSMLKCC